MPPVSWAPSLNPSGRMLGELGRISAPVRGAVRGRVHGERVPSAGYAGLGKRTPLQSRIRSFSPNRYKEWAGQFTGNRSHLPTVFVICLRRRALNLIECNDSSGDGFHAGKY